MLRVKNSDIFANKNYEKMCFYKKVQPKMSVILRQL